jgi:hypothetical protein
MSPLLEGASWELSVFTPACACIHEIDIVTDWFPTAQCLEPRQISNRTWVSYNAPHIAGSTTDRGFQPLSAPPPKWRAL